MTSIVVMKEWRKKEENNENNSKRQVSKKVQSKCITNRNTRWRQKLTCAHFKRWQLEKWTFFSTVDISNFGQKTRKIKLFFYFRFLGPGSGQNFVCLFAVYQRNIKIYDVKFGKYVKFGLFYDIHP